MLQHKFPLLMAMGPAQMEPEIRKLGEAQSMYFRTAEYSELWSKLNIGLQWLFETRQPVFSVSTSGTGVMQMAVDNLCNPGEAVIVMRSGLFSQRWIDIASSAQAKINEFLIPDGFNASGKEVEEALSLYPEAKILFTTYNETSTTALADLNSISNIVKKHNILWVVDAVSALGVEPLAMDDLGIDVAITSSQKALALPPGLAFIAFSSKAWDHIQKISCKSFFFDAKHYYKDWVRNQSPFTPPTSILLQLEYRLDKMQAIGKEMYRCHYNKMTSYLRGLMLDLGLEFVSQHMGNCTTAVKLPSHVDAMLVASKLRNEYQIVVIPPYPGSNIIRIGNYGDITKENISFFGSSLSECLKLCLHNK